MQNLLLVNLMRMGDILQMTPLIQGLRERLPQARISVVLNEAFVEVARRIDVDAILPFPMRSFLDVVSGKEGLAQGHKCLTELVRAVNEHGIYDLVFNLTPSRSASSFCSLIAHDARCGMWLRDDGSFQAADPWAAYLVAMMANRRTNPFHLVDIWLRALGQQGPRSLRMSLSSQDLRRADSLLTGSGVNLDRDLLIGFQVSASQKEKCWSEKEFVRLGRSVQQGLNARALLFGVAGEVSLCQRISNLVPGSVNLAGRTDVGELAGALKRCRVLVTNDTGTQHVATAVGTPVVVISVGPVFFRETGPYGEGHLIFQARLPCAPCSFRVTCLKPVCKEVIHAQLVYKALVRLLRGEKGVPGDLPQEVSCYRSSFDHEGYLEYSSQSATPEDRKLRAYKSFWRGLLEDGISASSEQETDGLNAGSRRDRSRLQALLRRSSTLICQIREAGSAGRSKDPSRLKVLSGNIKTAEQEMKRLAQETNELAPVMHYLVLRREALSVRDSFQFLEETSSLYSRAADQIRRQFESPGARKEARSHG